MWRCSAGTRGHSHPAQLVGPWCLDRGLLGLWLRVPIRRHRLCRRSSRPGRLGPRMELGAARRVVGHRVGRDRPDWLSLAGPRLDAGRACPLSLAVALDHDRRRHSAVVDAGPDQTVCPPACGAVVCPALYAARQLDLGRWLAGEPGPEPGPGTRFHRPGGRQPRAPGWCGECPGRHARFRRTRSGSPGGNAAPTAHAAGRGWHGPTCSGWRGLCAHAATAPAAICHARRLDGPDRQHGLVDQHTGPRSG